MPMPEIQNAEPVELEDPNAVAGADDAPEAPHITTDDDGSIQVEERASRRDRRNGRFVKMTEERDTIRSELEAARREIAEMRGRLDASTQYQPPQQRQADPQQSPHDRELAGIRKEMETIQHALRSGVDDTTAETLKKRFYELDDRRDAVIEDRAVEKAAARLAAQQQPRDGDYEAQVLRSEFGDVQRNPQAIKWALGRYHQAIAEGAPDNLETSRAALLEAAHKFNIRRPTMPPVSAAVQQRFGAVSAQAGARSMGDAVRLSKEEQKMALARWPEVDDNVAFANMAKLLRKARENE